MLSSLVRFQVSYLSEAFYQLEHFPEGVNWKSKESLVAERYDTDVWFLRKNGGLILREKAVGDSSRWFEVGSIFRVSWAMKSWRRRQKKMTTPKDQCFQESGAKMIKSVQVAREIVIKDYTIIHLRLRTLRSIDATATRNFKNKNSRLES